MLVNQFLDKSVAQFPDKTALVQQERRWTYTQVEEMTNRLAHALKAKGLAPGDRVIIYLPNSLEIIVSLFAILKVGGIYSVVNFQSEAERLKYILQDSQATMLITKVNRAKLLKSLIAELPDLKLGVLVDSQEPSVNETICTYDDLIASGDSSPLPVIRKDTDLASIMYTSGSTGMPKGVMYTHANEYAVQTSIVTYLENNADDIILNVLSLASSYGLCQVFATFLTGATLVVEPAFGYPFEIVKRIQNEKITGMAGVPSIWSVLLDLDLSQFEFPHLRFITNAGSGLPAPYVGRLQKAFPNTALYAMYGQTECRRVSYMPPDKVADYPTSSGISIPGCEVWLVDEENNRLGPGEVGELVVRGPHVMLGYWNLPEKTAKKLQPGPNPGEKVLYTGDLFKMDEHGHLYFVSRTDDIIKCKGEKVSPVEVENVLYQIEGVTEAAVIGVADARLGEAVKAFMVLTDGMSLTERDIMIHCRRHLAEFKLPRQIEFREQLPKTATGKIHKPTLRAESQSTRAGAG